MKKTWEGIREIVHTKNRPNSNITQLKSKDNIIDEPKKISNTFCNFFTNVGLNIDKDIPKSPHVTPVHYLKDRVDTNFDILPTNNNEVIKIIAHLDDTKSTGPSSIPVNLLKIAAPIITPYIVQIVNKSFSTGIFPNAVKLAKVIPIFKAGSIYDVNNYRPISLLSVFSKIIEKIMHQRLYLFLESHNVFFKSQFGFQKNKSTQQSLIEIVEKIRGCIESKNYGCGIFIDLKKAFDTVNHNILLQKLEHYGVRGNGLLWFESYLKDRTQYVSCNNVSSETKTISCGVPQGSVLGPLLFLLYINDLPNISKKLNFFLFADDTNLFYECNNLEKLERVVNKELKKLVTWLNVNRLALNVSKTNYVIFAAINKPIKPTTIIINRQAIEQKEYVKYLGVLIDSRLSFKYHISATTKKMARAVGIISKLRHYVNKKILLMIYYSLIYPFLIYALPVWGNACNTHLDSVHIIQKKVVRLITFNDIFYKNSQPPCHSSPLFKELEILNIYDLFKLLVSKFVHDCLSFKNPHQFHDYFKYPPNNHNTDDNRNDKLRIPMCRTSNYGLKSVKTIGAHIWNEIPNNVRSIHSIKPFTKAYKKTLIDAL